MESEHITITVDASIEEIRRTVWPDRTMVLLGFFFWIFAGIWAAVTVLQGVFGGVDRDLISPVIFVIAAAFGLWSNARDWREKSGLLANEIRDLGIKSIRFDESGVAVKVGDKTKSFSWGDFIRVLETKADFFFYTDPINRWGIPRRCFESEEHIIRFRRMLKEALGPVAVLRKR